jgi:hypothetical protein
MNLIADLQQVNISENIRLCSFDIKNMYSNIPTEDISKLIIDVAMKNYIHNDVTQGIEQLTNLVIEQNYFKMNSKYYHQSEGLAMGAPSSALLAEIYLQFLEHNLLLKHKILSYHRYVDDILIIYNSLSTNINETLSDFNDLHHKIQFTIENEINSQMNFLDCTISRRHNNLHFGIFRKHTATDIMIRNDSCHPAEHKMSGMNYLINRITNYPITYSNLKKEIQIIDLLLTSNGYKHFKTIELIQKKKHIRKENIIQTQKMGKIYICWQRSQIYNETI